MNKPFKDYYLILQVHMLAKDEVIRAAYKRLCTLYHPDNGGNHEAFSNVKEAYSVLSNETARKKYDRKWNNHYISSNPEFHDDMKGSIYENNFLSVKKIVLEYMYLIMHKEYEMAYYMLSESNRKKIFKKEFIKWQSLVGEIHELLEFDCVLDSFMVDHDGRQIMVYKVKLIERNYLLNRVEEDYFRRRLVYEEGKWNIDLPDIDLKSIIKKYKKLIHTSKKKEALKRLKIDDNELYTSKNTNMSTFINNCEYEFLRYKRYGRKFSVIRLQIDFVKDKLNEEKLVENTLMEYTRNMDSFSRYNKNTYIVLLPETGEKDSYRVMDKIEYRLTESFKEKARGSRLRFYQKALTIDDTYEGTKAFLLDAVIDKR